MTKYYRTATIADVIPKDKRESRLTFASADAVANHVSLIGPVRARVRTHRTFVADRRTGLLTAQGVKGERIDCAVVGYDPATRYFRLLMPLGLAWGQAGRCWVTFEQMSEWCRPGSTATIDAPAHASGDLGLAPGASLDDVGALLDVMWGEAEFVVQWRAASASRRVEMLDRWARGIELSDLDPEPEPEPGDPVH